MDFFATLVLILSSNLDTLALGFAYAARGTHIPVKNQLLIAATTAAFTFLALSVGQGILRLLPAAAVSYCESHSDKILGAVLILFGVIQIIRG